MGATWIELKVFPKLFSSETYGTEMAANITIIFFRQKGGYIPGNATLTVIKPVMSSKCTKSKVIINCKNMNLVQKKFLPP